MPTRLRILVCAFIFTTAFASIAMPQRAQRKGNVVGSIWTFNLAKGPRGGGESRHINLRVYNHEIFLRAKKVGFVKPMGPLDATLTIDGFPKMNGTATITKVRNLDPPEWQGTFKQDDGTEWRLSIEGVED